ncbi:hypothetical protein, partial [Paraclostridium bifermentans]|uniref:hypothetical protein n=1 Tax=Paraclostridium bifermentans TaxID=1490 RepID=UPI00374F4FCA
NKLNIKRLSFKNSKKVLKITLPLLIVIGAGLFMFKGKDINLGDLNDTQYDYLCDPKYEITSDNKEDMIKFFENYNELKPDIQVSWLSLARLKMDKLGMNKYLIPQVVDRPKFKNKGRDTKEVRQQVEECVYQIENACKSIELIDKKFDVMHDDYANTWHVESLKIYNEIINYNIDKLQRLRLTSYFDVFQIDFTTAYSINQRRSEDFNKGFYDNIDKYKSNGIGLCDDIRNSIEKASQQYIR